MQLSLCIKCIIFLCCFCCLDFNSSNFKFMCNVYPINARKHDRKVYYACGEAMKWLCAYQAIFVYYTKPDAITVAFLSTYSNIVYLEIFHDDVNASLWHYLRGRSHICMCLSCSLRPTLNTHKNNKCVGEICLSRRLIELCCLFTYSPWLCVFDLCNERGSNKREGDKREREDL